jgi:hypothetical protein
MFGLQTTYFFAQRGVIYLIHPGTSVWFLRKYI